MILSAQQLEKLRPPLLERADALLANYLQRRFPMIGSVLDADGVRRFVRSHRYAALKYGIDREDNVAVYLDIVAMYGPDFPTQEWARDVLSSRLHGPDKVALLRHRLSAHGVTFGADG